MKLITRNISIDVAHEIHDMAHEIQYTFDPINANGMIVLLLAGEKKQTFHRYLYITSGNMFEKYFINFVCQ